MRVDFIKMHGLGNDFVVLDGCAQPLPEMTGTLAAALADRHTGIGCDQVIVLAPSTRANLAMRIFNPDGSESSACGNATRAVALLRGGTTSIETLGGMLTAVAGESDIAVDMGTPRFAWEDIPLAYPLDTLALPVAWEDLENPCAVNVGNPHAVFFVSDCDAVDLGRLGPLIEHDPLFPQGVNVNAAMVVSRNAIRLRVWERGTGLTRACGTGACATAVAAMRRGLTEREVGVTLPGGDLHIAWGTDDRITMTGPANEAFRGSFDPAEFGA